MMIFAHSCDSNDGYEIRLIIDRPEKLIHGRYVYGSPDEYIVIGTIHAGDMWALNEMFDEDRPDVATPRQQQYVVHRIESFLAAHGLQTVSADLNDHWRQLDEMATSLIEPGPPYARCVPVSMVAGAATPSIRF